MRSIGLLIISVLAMLFSYAAQANDVVIIDAPDSVIDRRNDFTNQLLTAILKKTESHYGSFTLGYAPQYMYRDRLLGELRQGKVVNVTAKATRPDWESSDLITVRIPVDKGITDYRLFLINRSDQDRFSQITSLDTLKKLTLGVGHAWSSRQVFEENGFRQEVAANWEGLYKMLEARRFDYFPRALSEIFVEYDDRHVAYPEMAIEKSLVLYFPLPKYFFVSPNEPRLARRIEEGFQAMIRDGSFDELFLAYHKPMIERANFCARRLFRIPNPQLSPKTPLSQPAYWYDPYAHCKKHPASPSK